MHGARGVAGPHIEVDDKDGPATLNNRIGISYDVIAVICASMQGRMKLDPLVVDRRKGHGV
jgi:hypothetical protein